MVRWACLIVVVVSVSLVGLMPGRGLAAEEASGRPEVAVEVGAIECFPQGGHGLVSARVVPSKAALSARLYFTAPQFTAPYYVEMERGSDGSFWGITPLPLEDTKEVSYHVLVNTPRGAVNSSVLKTKVTTDCAVQMTEVQQRASQALTVGHTVKEQRGERVWGFRCSHIVARIWIDGTVHLDEVCQVAGLPPWKNLIPAGVAATTIGVVLIDEETEDPASPSKP